MLAELSTQRCTTSDVSHAQSKHAPLPLPRKLSSTAQKPDFSAASRHETCKPAATRREIHHPSWCGGHNLNPNVIHQLCRDESILYGPPPNDLIFAEGRSHRRLF